MKINMKDYIAAMLDKVPDTMKGTVCTPAANHLFEVRNTAAKLNKDHAERFHHLTAKLLYLSQWGRPDIRTAVAFLSTRVSQTDVNDKKKLGRVMKYLCRSINLELTLSADSPPHTTWWVDAAYGVGKGMKSQTRA